MKLSRSVLVNASILVLGVASLVAVAVTNGSVTSKDLEGREQSLLPVFRAEDVIRLELSANGPPIQLERVQTVDGGSAAFQLVAPVKELADAATVDKFLGGLGGAKLLRPVADNLTRAALGLDHPSARIVLTTVKSSYELALGDPAPAPEGARYVEVKAAGAPPRLLVVGKSVAEDLTFDLDGFRLRSLISVSEADVTRVRLTSQSLNLDLVRGAGRTFLVEGEPKVRADRETVSSLFFQLGRASANRFLSLVEAEPALGGQSAHFAIETKDPSGALSFDVGGSCPGEDSQLVVVRRAPGVQAACVTRELDATLKLKRDAFQDSHAFSLHVDEVEELAISAGPTKLRLVRKGTGFVLHTKSDADIELEPGNQRIMDVLEARGERVEGAKSNELGLEPGQDQVRLRSAAARESDVAEEVVRVGTRDSAGNLFVYREADGITLKIPQNQARAFALDSTLLYSKKLSEFGPSSFISAEIERRQGKEVLRRGPGEALELESPKGFDPDGGLSADVIQALGALSAERFMADSDDGSFGLAHSPLRVRFAFKGEQGKKIERTLTFGDETPLGVCATLDQNGPVFVLPRTVEEALDTLLVNRSVFSAEPASLQAFALEAGHRSLYFERHGGELEPTPNGSFPADRLPDLWETLGNLRPEAGLHIGPAEPMEGLSKPILTLRLTPLKGAPQTVTFGAGDSWRATSIFYLRVAGVDATFVIAQSKVRPLLAAF